MPAPILASAASREAEGLSLDGLIHVAHEASPDGILVVDVKGRMASFNRRFVQMWGISRRVARSRSDRQALRSVLDKLVDPQGFLARVQYLYGNRRERSQDELALKDGRIFQRHSVPVFTTTREYFGRIWYFRDVTERKRAEEKKRQDERLRLHREFVANVSHELRTPLTAIEGFTETLLRGALDDGRNRKRFLKTIIEHSRRLRRLLDGLLELSHLESGPSPVRAAALDLRKFLGDFVLGMRPVFQRKGISLASKIEPGLEVAVDEAHLSRIAGNLLDNAVKFSPPRGRVTLVAKRAGSRVRVSVVDQGIGIPPAETKTIFERFQRSSAAKRNGIPGTGLGLPLVKELVERHGGRIWVESREGNGSQFHFTLPAASRKAVK